MAQRTVTGVIARVNSKTWEDSGNTTYSFQLEGSNQWFRAGMKPVPAGVGQNVKFVANEATVDMSTFALVQSQVAAAPSVAPAASPVVAPSSTATAPVATAAPASAAPGPSAPRASSGRTGYNRGNQAKDQYWTDKEARDLEKDARYQAVSEPRMALSVAVEAASQLVSTAINKDALSFGNAAKAKRLGLLADYTKELALELAVFIQDAPNQLAAYKANAGSPESAKGTNTGEVAE